MTWWTDSFFMTSVSTRLKPRSSGWQRMSVPRRGFIRSQRGVIFNPPWRQTCHQLSTDSGKGKWFGQINHLTHWWIVSTPACLKGTADRRAPTGWLKARLANLSFEGWLSLSDKYFSVAVQGEDIDIQIRQALSGTDVTVGKEAWQQQQVRWSSSGWKTCAPGPDGDNTHNNHRFFFFFISRPVFTPFCFAITIKAHLLVPSPWPAFRLVCDSGSNGAREVWGACPLYPELRHEWTRVPLTAGLRNPSASSAVDALMSSLLAAM